MSGMIKYIDQIEHEDSFVERIGKKAEFMKTASSKKLSKEIESFVDALVPKKGKGYLLIAAMTDENWGDNNNGDYFPTKGLANDTDDYGHKTFVLHGHYYRDHKNKDPEKSFGKPVFSHFNDKMARVELIVEYDIEKDDWTNWAIENDVDIKVSMGTKVGFDVCSICHPNWRDLYKIPEKEIRRIAASNSLKEIYAIGNKYGVDLSYMSELNEGGGLKGIAATPERYCDHIKYQRRRIMPGGRKAYMINMFPTFFDISNLTSPLKAGRPADRSAMVLAKVANEAEGSEDTIKNVEELEVSLKNAEADKSADIEKEVEGEVLSDDDKKIKDYLNGNITPLLRDTEEDLPKDVIDKLVPFGMDKIISTMLGLGMCPKPKEFQRITLIIMGKRGEADEYENKGMVITDSDVDKMMGMEDVVNVKDSPYDIKGENISDDIIDILKPFISRKSYYSKPMVSRIIMIKKAKAINTPLEYTSDTHKTALPTALLAIAAYMGLAKLSGKKALQSVLQDMWQNRYRMMGAVAGAMAITEVGKGMMAETQANDMYNIKKASASTFAKSILAITPLTYLYSQHQINRARRGESLSTVNRLIAKHPGTTAIGGIMLANKPTRQMIGGIAKMPFKWLTKGAMEEMVKQGMGFEGMDISKYAAEDQPRVIVALWDTIANVEKEGVEYELE